MRKKILPLLLVLTIFLSGCSVLDNSKIPFVFSWIIKGQVNTLPDYDSMAPEEFAKAVLCGNWQAYAVCQTDYQFSYYTFDPTYCSRESLPDLYDLAKQSSYVDVEEDAAGCKTYTISIFENGVAYLRYANGKRIEVEYEIQRISEEEIFCQLYKGGKSGYFLAYLDDSVLGKKQYILKACCSSILLTSASIKQETS